MKVTAKIDIFIPIIILLFFNTALFADIKTEIYSDVDKETKREIEKEIVAKVGENRPQIFISPKYYNFGKISKSKKKLELVVKLENRGNEVLTINNLKTSCACTTVKFRTDKYESRDIGIRGVVPEWKVSLAPQEKAELIIVTDLNHPHIKMGRILRIVEIKSNDPINPIMKVEFEAEIVK
jgi:hypothetical protein